MNLFGVIFNVKLLMLSMTECSKLDSVILLLKSNSDKICFYDFMSMFLISYKISFISKLSPPWRNLIKYGRRIVVSLFGRCDIFPPNSRWPCACSFRIEVIVNKVYVRKLFNFEWTIPERFFFCILILLYSICYN